MCLHNIGCLSVAPVPQCSHSHWYFGWLFYWYWWHPGRDVWETSRLEPAHLSFNTGCVLDLTGDSQCVGQEACAASPGFLLTPAAAWKIRHKWRGNTIQAGINSLGGREDVDRGLGLEEGVWEEATRTKLQISSGVRGRGAEMRWRTCPRHGNPLQPWPHIPVGCAW